MDRHKKSIKLYLYTVTVIVALLAIVILYRSRGIPDIMTSIEALGEYIRGFGSYAFIVFFLIQLLSVIFAPIPSHISTLVGAAIFGMWVSFVISWLAIATGSVIVFVMARKLGKPFVDKIVSTKVSGRYKRLISSERGEILLALLLFFPFFPDDAICFVAGLSKIRLDRYILIMLLTRPWGILAASALGSSEMPMEWWVLGTAVLVLYFCLNRRYEIKKMLFEIIGKINVDKQRG
jgi:uncharacterized membrane protein YdjX (TVP38/TMEM64 family)